MKENARQISLPDRRLVLGFGAALGAGVFSHARAADSAHRISVHSHHAPPAWAAAIKGTPNDAPPNQTWSAARQFEDMDKAGIAVAVNSVTQPGVVFLNPESAIRVARESNEFSAKLGGDFKGRFANFATLPMPAVDASLKEIAYALDVLKMEGVCLMTSYNDKWLGHKDFAPVMDELHRRKANVFVHPTRTNCCAQSVPDIGPSLFEFNTDTTRTVASLIFTSTADRCRDINFIFSHGGGTVPMLVDRFNNTPLSDKRYASFTPEGVMAALRRFHYDTAIAANAPAMAALKAMVPISQILYGTDFPFRPSPPQTASLQPLFTKDELALVERGNALRLMPGLA